LVYCIEIVAPFYCSPFPHTILIYFNNHRSSIPGGAAVLHTIANNGGCSDKWGNILKVSKAAVDREMKRALEYKFQRNIAEPLATVYKYWDEGFW